MLERKASGERYPAGGKRREISQQLTAR
jgi:hypothetical protein